MAAYDNPGLQQGTGGPTHVESAQGDLFVLGTTLLADNPHLLPTYFKQAGYPMTTLSKIRSFNFGRLNLNRAVEGPITGHYEKPRAKETITIGSIIGVDGNSIEVALTEDDMQAFTNSYGQAFLQSRPRVTEVYQFVAGGALYRVTEKDETTNPHQITLQANSDIDPEDEIIEGVSGFYVSTVKGEATGQVSPLRTTRYKYQNTFWISDETDITSGSHLTTAVSFSVVPGSNLLWMEGIQDMEMRNEQAKGKTWMFGQQTSGADRWTDYSDAMKSNVVIPGTQGFLPYAQENGYDFSYDPDDFGEDDIRALSTYFHNIRVGSSEIMLFEGYGINQKIEQYWSDKLNYNWVIGLSERYMSEGVRNARKSDNSFTEEGMFINLGVTGFAMGNFTFLQTVAPEFNYMQGAGAVGYSDWLIAAPIGRTEAAEGTPYLGYEWRGTEGYSREDEVWCETGAGSRAITKRSDFYKTSQIDAHRTYIRSEIAPHFALGESFVVMHPQGSSPS